MDFRSNTEVTVPWDVTFVYSDLDDSTNVHKTKYGRPLSVNDECFALHYHTILPAAVYTYRNEPYTASKVKFPKTIFYRGTLKKRRSKKTQIKYHHHADDVILPRWDNIHNKDIFTVWKIIPTTESIPFLQLKTELLTQEIQLLTQQNQNNQNAKPNTNSQSSARYQYNIQQHNSQLISQIIEEDDDDQDINISNDINDDDQDINISNDANDDDFPSPSGSPNPISSNVTSAPSQTSNPTTSDPISSNPTTSNPISSNVTSAPSQTSNPIPPDVTSALSQSSNVKTDSNAKLQRQRMTRFLNKDFHKRQKYHRKGQKVGLICRTSNRRATETVKVNHKMPIKFSTKHEFCLRYEDPQQRWGRTCVEIWAGMKREGFKVGKTADACQKWKYNGSHYYHDLIMKKGNDGFKLCCYIIFISRTQPIFGDNASIFF